MCSARSVRPGRFYADARSRGFTIVEILVVLGVLAVLLGLLFPALSSIRRSAKMTSELSAARQSMLAYASYASVNREAVLPGYKSGLLAKDDQGQPVGSIPARRYPWRLAPYLDYVLEGLYLNEHGETLEELRQTEHEHFVYVVSLFPSLGLNATWVGGHEGNYGFNESSIDLFGRFWVERLTEIRHTDRLMIFASARGSDPFSGGGSATANIYEGYFEVRSPYMFEVNGYMWHDEVYHAGPTPSDFGFLSPRHTDERCVVGLADGHTDALRFDELKDMRHWSNDADAADWTLASP